jgi:hypothetical protein
VCSNAHPYRDIRRLVLLALALNLAAAGSSAWAQQPNRASFVGVLSGGPVPEDPGYEALRVTNLAHPGANVTGLSSMAAELSAKRLQLLKDVIPRPAQSVLQHADQVIRW